MASKKERAEQHAPAAGQGPEKLEGVLERVTFVNDENGWGVFRVSVDGRPDLVTVVGNLLSVQPGETLLMTGRWSVSRQYGEQFDVESYETVRPSSVLGIERYLGSGLVKGVGKVFASRLVQAFGEKTLDVIENSPERLAAVEGIGRKRIERIVEAWAEHREIREVMVFLQSHGVSPAFAVKIYKRYGSASIATVKEDPYKLARDIYGIGFKTADRIALAMGIPADSPKRAAAGLLFALSEASDEGHVFLPKDLLIEKSLQMLGIAGEILEQALLDLAAAGDVRLEGRPDLCAAPDGDEENARQIVLQTGNNAPVCGRLAPIDARVPVYLRSLHIAETGIAARIRSIMTAPLVRAPVDVGRAISWFEEKQGIELAEAQREAVARAISSKVMVITGGPGTGKTTLLKCIIRILEKKGVKIRLAAPTGRAAKRMSEATGREAATIHRLLEFSPKTMKFERNQDHPLDADLLIVDETSMLDTILAYSLLKAVPLSGQIIFVGDVDQLPSVGPGAVLADLIDSGVVPVVRLNAVFRQARRSLIVVNSHRINDGEFPIEGEGNDRDFYFIGRDEPERCLSSIRNLVLNRLPRAFGFDPFNDIQVLTPMRRGLLGSQSLNAELQRTLNPAGKAIFCGTRVFRVGDKVMQMCNNYDLDVFNGDLGRIIAVSDEDRTAVVEFDGRRVIYESGDLDELALAYAVTIHKSQGSEYPCVVIPIHTQHFVMLQRNLIYTAVTRARKMVILIGSKKALGIALRTVDQGKRFTRLAQRLNDICAPAEKGSF